MKLKLASAFISGLLLAPLFVSGADILPSDKRLAPPKDLNGYFPFHPPQTKIEWDTRAEFVRTQILLSQGLWPMPTKTPLKAVIHGKIDRPDHTVEKVYFESSPGFFVTGNLYKPKNVKGKVPGVLFAHGHWKDARLSEEAPNKVRHEIATGEERFEKGGVSRFQAMCIQLARMGCVVWQWDMLSDSDSHQFSREVVHTFGKQRPEMNKTENWGLYSPQAESNLQSIMGLQTWNAIRSMDFLLSIPEVDSERTAMTGASGGGTQTMLLAAIDPRLKLSFPAVMVSTSMQGGCTCENSSMLRVNTGNVEFAALFAPKPQGMTTANDWTKEMATKGFPDLKKLYSTLGKPENVMLHRGEHHPHNYNSLSRSAFFTFLNHHFKLGHKSPVIENDFDPLTPAQLTVWDAQHPEPKTNGPDFERYLLKYFKDDSEQLLQPSTSSAAALRNGIGKAVEIIIGRSYAQAGDSDWILNDKKDKGKYVEMTGIIRNKTYAEELPVTWLYPKEWKGQAVVWLDDAGKSSLYNADGSVKAGVQELLNAGATVMGADLLFQGAFLKDGKPMKQTRLVSNPREFAGFTYGYNHTLFAQRTHDVLTLTRFLKTAKIGSHPQPTLIGVAGFGEIGPVVIAARALAGDAIDRAAVDTKGFRFSNLLDYRDPSFLPGGSKYLDLPGMMALNAPHAIWLAGETKTPAFVSDIYTKAGAATKFNLFAGDASKQELEAGKWLVK